MQEYYLVRLDRPQNVGVKDMKKYIKEAIGGWKGQFSPEDPLFDLKNKISVKRLPWDNNVPFPPF